MLLKHDTLRGIEAGRISLVFRRWRRPTVKAGGTLLTAVGQLAIEAVDRIELDRIDASDAEAAGFETPAALFAALARAPDGDVYRVRLSFAGPDPRIALRTRLPDADALRELEGTLTRMDARASGGPWTRQTLELIEAQPGVRAPDLAVSVGMERDPFKARVRKLKRLGLTESLKVGYRLSPRGAATLAALRESEGTE